MSSNLTTSAVGSPGHPPTEDSRLPAADEGSLLSAGRRQLGLLEFLETLWRARWLTVAVMSVFIATAVTYVMMASELYRADVVLMPAVAKSTQGLSGQLAGLGGLASLAGITIGGGGTVEPLAVLRSREFVRAFIEEENLMPTLFADKWDAAESRWKSKKNEKDLPDIRDAVDVFEREIRRVDEDKKTGLVTLSIEWKDAKVAADWANAMAERLNERMRQRALSDAEANVAYLRRESTGTQVVALQESLGRLLEGEMQKVMLARGNREFAFRIIDRAEISKRRSRPNRVRIVAVAIMTGSLLSVLGAFALQVFRQYQGERLRASSPEPFSRGGP